MKVVTHINWRLAMLNTSVIRATRRSSFSLHGSVLVALVHGKPVYMSCVIRRVLLAPQRVVSQALTVSKEHRFIARRLRRPFWGSANGP